MGVVLLADPEVSAVTLRESGEPLVDLTVVGVPHRATGVGARVRSGVASRLADAHRSLPTGFGLLVVQGSRTVEEQTRIFAAYRATVAAAHPGASAAKVERLTSRFVAPLGVAPHIAGAAVDVTLTDGRGVPLWMGTEIDATPETSDGACWTDAPGLRSQVRARRGVLASALGAVGLVNYPTEWWHWSYGDRYWAVVTGAESALYGPA